MDCCRRVILSKYAEHALDAEHTLYASRILYMGA